MAEISQAIIGALQGATAELTSAVSSLASSISSIMLSKADKSSPAFTGGMKIGDLPTAAAGLTSGSLWVDTANGNVIKVVL